MTHLTYLERRWPDSPSFQQIASNWCRDQSRLILDMVWKGYDQLLAQDLNKVPFSTDDEAKEESLNYLLKLRISQCMSGDEPFVVVHEPPEQTKRKRGRGKSPHPDIGFALNNHPRTIWPLEAKVLANEKDTKPYLAEINDNFLTGRYATFSSEGAMLGYVLRGELSQVFEGITTGLKQAIKQHPHFPDRPHKISKHQREEVPHRNSPREFTCHHLLLRIPIANGATLGADRQ